MFVFVDANSRNSWVILLNHKSEAASRFREWKGLVKAEKGVKVLRLWTQLGGKFTSNALKS